MTMLFIQTPWALDAVLIIEWLLINMKKAGFHTWESDMDTRLDSTVGLRATRGEMCA